MRQPVVSQQRALPAVSARTWGIGRDCTGPDAAGFPIAPLLFTIGNVLSGRVEHAIRFALPNDRMQYAPTSSAEGAVYVWPATHAGGPSAISADAPIYGSRWRLKSNFDPASRGLDPNNADAEARRHVHAAARRVTSVTGAETPMRSRSQIGGQEKFLPI